MTGIGRDHLGFDDPDPDGDDPSPICAFCGVSALAPEPHSDADSICENADCDAFGTAIN